MAVDPYWFNFIKERVQKRCPDLCEDKLTVLSEYFCKKFLELCGRDQDMADFFLDDLAGKRSFQGICNRYHISISRYIPRSEERRVGKESRSRWSPDQ